MENVKTSLWILDNQDGIESLRLEENAAIPELREEEVLVEMHAASLNYRDLMIAKVRIPQLIVIALLRSFN